MNKWKNIFEIPVVIEHKKGECRKMGKLSEEEICKVVDLLIGSVDPVGDSRIDRDRMVNLKHLTFLIDYCLDRVSSAADNSTSPEGSVREIGRYALWYLAESAEWFNDRKRRWDNENMQSIEN